MTIHRRDLLAGAALLAAPGAARAQTWPRRQITLVNPFAAGGQSDAIGRVVAAHLQTVLGQPVVLENRVGAGGTVGAQVVARAEPDGHTILFGTTSTYSVAPAVNRRPGYDPETSFAPITIATEGAMVLCAHPDRPYRTTRELIAVAKAQPGRITYASAGNGSLPHVLAALFASEAGVELVHVPYRGGAPAMNDLIAGQVDLMVEQIANVAQNAQAGRIRPLFVTSARPAPLLPEVPPATKVGLPALALTSWAGFAAPRGTAPQIIERFADEVRIALATDEARGLAAKLGVEVIALGPAAMGARVARELAVFRQVARSANISIE